MLLWQVYIFTEVCNTNSSYTAQGTVQNYVSVTSRLGINTKLRHSLQ